MAPGYENLVKKIFWSYPPQPPDIDIEAALDDSYIPLLEEMILQLDDRDQDVIRRRFGLNGEKETLKAIAEDYGVSPGRIAQVEYRSLRKLRFPKRSFFIRKKLSEAGLLEAPSERFNPTDQS